MSRKREKERRDLEKYKGQIETLYTAENDNFDHPC